MAKFGKSILPGILVFALVLSPAVLASEPDPAGSLPIVADGEDYPGEVRLEDGAAWVGVREFSQFASGGSASVDWDPERQAAHIRTDRLDMTAEAGERILEANGRLLWCAGPVYIRNEAMFVPLRQIAAAFGYDCRYDEEERAAVLTRVREAVLPRDRAEDREDALWLSRIIEAEAGAEPFLGKLAVGAVILNRVESEEFPDTVREVIFDTAGGVQFTPTENGTIWGEAGEESIRAALVTLDNPPLWEGIAYFLNPRIARSLWIPETREFAFSVGGHDFYR